MIERQNILYMALCGRKDYKLHGKKRIERKYDYFKVISLMNIKFISLLQKKTSYQFGLLVCQLWLYSVWCGNSPDTVSVVSRAVMNEGGISFTVSGLFFLSVLSCWCSAFPVHCHLFFFFQTDLDTSFFCFGFFLML